MTSSTRLQRIDLLALVLLVIAAAGCQGCKREAGAAPSEGRYLAAEGIDARPKLATGGLQLTAVAGSYTRPLDLTAPKGDPRLFVVEQPGTIRIVKDGKVLTKPFLDIRSKASNMLPYSEQGLLGLAFHPDYATNGRFFVHYTARKGGDTVLAEYKVSKKPDVADPDSERVLFKAQQPFVNHNGGKIAFGPDGMLYLGLGDGGSANDPLGNGQNPKTPLGSILRFDVSTVGIAKAAADNPFVDTDDGLDEVFVFGLRNPWRFSFDEKTGDLYIADVGQNTWEWVSVVPAGKKGLNFGWNAVEGFKCFATDDCDPTKYTNPIVSYDHEVGCSISGGYVYRGAKLEDVDGMFFYSDYCEPWVRSFRVKDGKLADHTDWTPLFKKAGLKAVSGFGRDGSGELYVLDHRKGKVWRIDPR